MAEKIPVAMGWFGAKAEGREVEMLLANRARGDEGGHRQGGGVGVGEHVAAAATGDRVLMDGATTILAASATRGRRKRR